MPTENEFIGGKGAYSLYEQYVSGGSQNKNRGRLEGEDSFRSDLSKYKIEKQTIVSGPSSKWDPANCGGVPLDYDGRNGLVYVDGSDSHTLLIGSTGSKKSRLVVMPTVRILAASGENMIICDPKGEIYNRTSSFLSRSGYQVHTINLRNPSRGDGWNILSIPYELYRTGEIDKACEFLNDMTINLIPITAKDPYWDYSARDMLFGLILLLFKICKESFQQNSTANMQNVFRLKEELFCSTESSYIQRTSLWKYAKQDDLIRMRLNGTVICPEKTMSCIISVFDQHLSFFSLQPQVMEMLRESTFNINDFGFGKNVFFIIMPDEKTTFHKLVVVFLKQLYELLIDTAFKKTDANRFPVRINVVLDEFSSLPTVSDFPQMISASRSRNIRFFLIVQSKHQLRQRYGEETSTIMSNCSNWVFLTTREIELLPEVSELGGSFGANREPLISVSRLQHLDKNTGECLVFNGRKNPYFSKLPDIDLYDQGIIEKIDCCTRSIREKSGLPLSFFESTASAIMNTSNLEKTQF